MILAKHRFILLLLGACLLLPFPLAHGQTSSISELREAIDAVIADANMPNAWWTVNVKEVETGNALYQKDTGRSFIPASNTKLYTTSAALDLLGPDFRYETSVWTDGVIKNGTLEGNLFVKGSGDPVIGGRFNGGDITRQFRDWADSLKAKGVNSIHGSIIGDDNAFDDQALGYGWQWDDLDFWYAAETGALSFNDNCVDFELIAQAENMPAEMKWEPMMTTFVSATNQTRTVAAGSPITEGYRRLPDSNAFVLSSLVPVGRTDFESLTVKNPTLYFVHVLREVLLKEGISIQGEAVDMDDLAVAPSYENGFLFSTFSPPFSDIVRVLNKNSQNLYAEQLLKTIAKEAPVSGYTPGSAAMGVARAKKLFGLAGIDTLRIQLVDGSGLARQNLVTSDMTMNLLLYMAHHPDPEVTRAFIDSLPIGGVDGTLSSRMKGTPAENNARAKTGTLGNAIALSGYVTTASGKQLAFSIMANHFVESSRGPRNVQDAIVALLAAYTN
ncbi:D-alanyl-D-alanine carboxypeptidase/D-alanyl-D-alanine-endopeptidase [bacterium]|nr:D-alanyl-D-alanine carboxypeptidase/D-alanyl-D-alanine-endopeptidase [bacterium]